MSGESPCTGYAAAGAATPGDWWSTSRTLSVPAIDCATCAPCNYRRARNRFRTEAVLWHCGSAEGQSHRTASLAALLREQCQCHKGEIPAGGDQTIHQTRVARSVPT